MIDKFDMLLTIALSFLTVLPQNQVRSESIVDACRQKVIKICSATESGSPVCEMLKSETAESEASIVDFLTMTLRIEDDNLMDDLFCARLMGPKEFIRISLSPIWKNGPMPMGTTVATERSSIAETGVDWEIHFLDKEFSQIAKNYEELRALKLGHAEYDGDFSVTFSGTVSKVELITHFRYGLVSVMIHVEDARISSIVTPDGEGCVEEMLEITGKLLKEAYSKYMTPKGEEGG